MAHSWLTITIVLIGLSIVEINSLKHRVVRQGTATNSACPTAPCDYVTCENGGQCQTNTTVAECYECRCLVGFTGKVCGTAINTNSTIGCNPVCQNNGTCVQTPSNSYTCTCTSEFTGNQCETSLIASHPCMTIPTTVCQNGGTCTINGASYACNCAAGWTGTSCQTAQNTADPCNPSPCGQHGNCLSVTLPTGPIAFCNCQNQWTGRYCDTNIGCPVGFCGSGGTCQLTNGNTPSCVCLPTHTGDRCQTLIAVSISTTTTTTTTTADTTVIGLLTTTTGTTTTDVSGVFTTTTMSTTVSTASPTGNCSSRPCLNGGTCYNSGNSFICLCTPTWSGPICDIPTSTPTPGGNACTPNPCINGGRCYKHGNGFVCVCPPQYTGLTCASQTVSTTSSSPSFVTCANQPCRNGGTCYNTGNSYFCYCGTNSAYTGTNCEIPKSPSPQDCPLNCGSGKCVLTGNTQMPHACVCNGAITPTSC